MASPRLLIVLLVALIAATMVSAYDFMHDPAFASIIPQDDILNLLQYQNMTGAAIYDLYKEGSDLKIFDVREVDEYAAGHIPTAVNIPLSQLPERYLEISACRTAFIHCQGGVRSIRAIEFLETKGYGNLINMQDGINGWIAAGGPIVKSAPTFDKKMEVILGDIVKSVGADMSELGL